MSVGGRGVAGWLPRGGHLLTPMSLTATRLAMARAAPLRRRRLVGAAWDGWSQRRRPTRPTMRALRVSPGGRFAWRSAPSPPLPGPRGALVHPIAVATCDLDRAVALGRTPFPLPLHFGHECVAEVLEVGAEVTEVRPGQRVVVPFQISCGWCARCRSGLTANCATVPPISMYGFGVGGGHWGGAFSDVLAVPYADGMLVTLPEGIEPAAAASVADNVSDGYRHIAPHLPGLRERDPDAGVLIIAAGTERSVLSASVPLYGGLIARALGARQVILADARPHVRSQAERLGLTAITPGALDDVCPAPLVMEATGRPQGLRAALRRTAEDGICTSVGQLSSSARIPVGLMYGRNATVHLGRAHARALIPRVLELMVGGLRPQDVTTHTGRIDDAPRRLHEHVHGNATKTVLTET